jgi:predicted ATPase
MNNIITQLQLTNFTKFSDLTIDFSPRINVIIGENSSGKTHLLKAAYALCTGRSSFKNDAEIDDDDLSNAVTAKLLKVFMPLENKLGNLRRHGAGNTGNAQMQMAFASDKKMRLSFHTNSKSVVLQDRDVYAQTLPSSVYIPTKEVLSIMEGLPSLYKKFALSFDQTYADIFAWLELPPARPEQVVGRTRWAMEEIEKTIGGKFIFHGGGRVTFKAGDDEYSANDMAEGFRKAGMMLRLLETTAIQPGISGPVFWDEPETNMNPKLMRMLVEILLEMSRMGQQIIIATHDYVLLKWFDLLRNPTDQIQFHSLYTDKTTGEVKVASTDQYLSVAPNAIDEAFGDLVDREIEKDMGSLGK